MLNRRSFMALGGSTLLVAGTRSISHAQCLPETPLVVRTSVHRIQADGIDVFYREAGSPEAPVVLLLHGFPSSSFQYRELIPRLARQVSCDRPGFAGVWL